MTSSLRPFFDAAGVALIGASANVHKLSHGILKNLLQFGYRGGIYPVNPGVTEILGKPCYADISVAPSPVELAVIILPSESIPDSLEACGKRGIRAAVIISGGFRETGTAGLELEQKCLEIARAYSMRLIGPNCVGLVNLHNGLNTTFINGMPDVGGIGFVSQSGAVCGAVVDLVKGKKVGFSHFISLGNEADVTETDIIEYLADDPTTTVIAAYVEQIRDGRRFLDIARQVTAKKPIVLLKAGRSGAGARAVSSHTGSMAGSYTAYQAAFKQAGVIEVTSVSDLFDTAMSLDFQPLPAANRAVILTNAGGPAALASDSLAVNGICLEDLTTVTTQALREFLNPAAQVGNPVDMLGGAEPMDYERAVKVLLADKNVDIVLPILVPQALVNPADVGRAIVNAGTGSGKPVLTCIMGDSSVGDARQVLQGNRFPMFIHPESMGQVLHSMLQLKEWRNARSDDEQLPALQINTTVLDRLIPPAGSARALGESETRPILEALTIPVIKGGFAANPVAAATLAAEIGFPVAVKVVAEEILHKSDMGGIRLNLHDQTEVLSACEQMFIDIGRKNPEARLKGVMVEQMAASNGHEMIVGMRRDPGFGPLLMFGMGGIYVELFKDVSFRVAPVGEREALEMIGETAAGKLLKGLRGAPPSDINAVVECICLISRLALAYPQIDEMEINPLIVYPAGQDALALDGRILVK